MTEKSGTVAAERGEQQPIGGLPEIVVLTDR